MGIDSGLDDDVEAETDVLKEELGNWAGDLKAGLRYLKGSDKLFMLAAYKLGWIGTQEEHEEFIRRAHDEGKIAEYVIGSYGEAVTRGIGSMALYLRALHGPAWLRAVAYPLIAHYVADAYLEIKKNPQKTGSNTTLVGIVRERFAKLSLRDLKRKVVEHYNAHGPVSREEALEAASRVAELDDQEGIGELYIERSPDESSGEATCPVKPSEEWLRKMADAEDNYTSVSAGVPFEPLDPSEPEEHPEH